MPTFDFHLPDFKAGMDQAQLAADVKKLKDYVYMLNEQLRYQFGHIDEENIAEGAITEDSLGTDLRRKVMDAEGNYSILKQTANAIEARVVANEGDIGQLEITATNISAEVSSTQVYRAADQTALLALLAAHDPVVSLAVGLLWYDTTNKLVKRCTVVSPVTWEVLQTNEVHTSYIDIQDNSIDIGSTGEINIESGGSINLASTGEMTVGTDTLADLLSTAATSQTTIWYQDNQPTATATGDIWYDTDANPVTIKRWNGSSWVDITTTALAQALSAASTAQSTADGKIISFAQNDAPSATAVGDLWVDTNDNNKLYRATAAGTGNWVLYKVASGYVSTSYITIDNDSIDIVSGGSLNLAAASQITIGTNPLSVGGTNLLPGTSGTYVSKVFEDIWAVELVGLVAVATYRVAPGDIVTARVYINNTLGAALRLDVIELNSSDTVLIRNYGNMVAGPSTGFSTVTFTLSASTAKLYISLDTEDDVNQTGTPQIKWLKLEKGNVATDWCESEGELHNSSITIDSAGIDIKSGGDLIATAPGTLQITGGSTDATAIAMRNDTDYFISAGHLTQSSAPFFVKKNGSIRASSGAIGGFTLSSGNLVDTATGGDAMTLNPSNGHYISNGLSIYGGTFVSSIYNSVDGSETQITATNAQVALFGNNSANLRVGYSATWGVWTNSSMYVTGAVGCESVVDHTPAFAGNALTALSAIKNDASGNLDHSTLPTESQRVLVVTVLDDKNQPVKDKSGNILTKEEPGRDLGMMISILTKAVQELTDIVNTQQKQIDKLSGVKA